METQIYQKDQGAIGSLRGCLQMMKFPKRERRGGVDFVIFLNLQKMNSVMSGLSKSFCESLL
jgi:hypothetical protein